MYGGKMSKQGAYQAFEVEVLRREQLTQSQQKFHILDALHAETHAIPSLAFIPSISRSIRFTPLPANRARFTRRQHRSLLA
jgi:hypothetical protein